ncbi:MAG: hypothetical protein A2Y67_03465 [Candidatus Buchananbacteria bacterium RBG_13_39_9]|uniref:Uncharacterized protein n=1 Tax=Candidatus Buchananbacteria bacterium RBG_13_39_9 TaxID=1797531 RepID=A0A1G1XSF3_9BACT|nr:MAG: hypothetical protein A2Y67_03465 [Candidatus Buchananbacteria bacterium RBG_13_39_9]
MSQDKEKGRKIEIELQKALGQIGKIHFQQIDPEDAHEEGDYVSIFPDKGERRRIERIIKNGKLSMKVVVAKRANRAHVDMDTIFST